MNCRRVFALDAYIDNLNMIFWLKFKYVCDVYVKLFEDMWELFEFNLELLSFIVKWYVNFVFAFIIVVYSRMGVFFADEFNVMN